MKYNMKKNYVKPVMESVGVNLQQMLNTSATGIEGSSGIIYGGAGGDIEPMGKDDFFSDDLININSLEY